jgi:hypothetical protein
VKRWALRVFVFLLLGAIVNVAVAWEWALRVPQRSRLPGDGTLLVEEHYGRPQAALAGRCWHRKYLEGNQVFPLRTLWPGFAINTLFYAAILWVLFAAPFALLRRRRVKRGLCPACAYPVGASEVCTECGQPVRPGQTAAA